MIQRLKLPPWARVLLLSIGLLFVPAMAWLLVPEPEPPKRVTIRTSRTDLPRQLAVEEEPEEPEPPSRSAPRPAEPEEPTAVEEEIRGMVTSGERVVSSAMVTCTKRGGEQVVATARHDGRFTLPLDADGCSAVARSPSYGASAPIEMRRGAENRLDLPGQGAISGEVTDDRGLAVAKFSVHLDHVIMDDGSRAPGGTRRQFDHPEGRFSLENMGAGKWTVVVSADGKPSKEVEVKVEGGKTTEGVRVRLDRGAMLIGTVIDRTSRRGIGGAEVSLDSGARGNNRAPVTTSPGGDFKMEGVPSGLFSVEVEHGDYLKRIVSGLDAKGQRELRVTIDLAPSGDAGGKLEMSGIGASLSGDGSGGVVVTGLREGGPAEKAGMHVEDVIAAIDGKSTEGFTIAQCVQLLRGPSGTEVAVSVRRGDGNVDLVITREVMVQ